MPQRALRDTLVLPDPATLYTKLTGSKDASMAPYMAAGTWWMSTAYACGAHFANFVNNRLEEDLKFQRKLMHSRDLGEVRAAQLAYMQTAAEQYLAETGKLADIGSKAMNDVPHETRH